MPAGTLLVFGLALLDLFILFLLRFDVVLFFIFIFDVIWSVSAFFVSCFLCVFVVSYHIPGIFLIRNLFVFLFLCLSWFFVSSGTEARSLRFRCTPTAS